MTTFNSIATGDACLCSHLPEQEVYMEEEEEMQTFSGYKVAFVIEAALLMHSS